MDEAEIALLVGGGLFKLFSQEGTLKAEGAQLKLRATQERLSTTNRMIQRDNTLQDVMSSQTAAESARGLSSASASFGAISGETFDNFAQDRNATLLNERFALNNIKQKQDDISEQKLLSPISDLFSTASQVAALHDQSSLSKEFAGSTSSESQTFGGL